MCWRQEKGGRESEFATRGGNGSKIAKKMGNSTKKKPIRKGFELGVKDTGSGWLRKKGDGSDILVPPTSLFLWQFLSLVKKVA